MPPMTPQQFAAKWKGVELKESAAYVEHFIEMCEIVGHAKPSNADPKGEFFTFQRGAAKEKGTPGFADVWLKDRFGLEYKGKGDDLDEAYKQLLQYRDNLANPPLLIVCDMDLIKIHTNFNGTVSETYTVTPEHLLDPSLRVKRKTVQGTELTTKWSGIEVLKFCFYEFEQLNPGNTPEQLTKDAADRFQKIADILRGWMPTENHQIARFLSRVIFCMFASDIGALPKGIVTKIEKATPYVPKEEFSNQMAALFRTMSGGGYFGADKIAHFNGGLFADDIEPVQTDGEVRAHLREADKLDWSQIEPSVFGTLFERIFDPSRRAQLGRHYTSREDIELLVKPVVMKPLEREWEAAREGLANSLSPVGEGEGEGEGEASNIDAPEAADSPSPLRAPPDRPAPRGHPARERVKDTLQSFMDRLGTVKVLDPACGSGNFLYVTLALLKELEQDVMAFGAGRGIFGLEPKVHPRQLFGIDKDEYAVELASIVVWIGHLQWQHRNGVPFTSPILVKLENIAEMDAVMEDRGGKEPREPEWPSVDYIVGNPPFLGGKRMRTEMSDRYVDRLFNLWDGRVRRESDLCCYWFEKARAQIESGKAKRAGLLATQGIRGGANRDVLRRIKESGDIFFAESDRLWVLDGAAVQISMVGFDDGSETERVLDGKPVAEINSNLTGTTADLTKARSLKENLGICFMGDTKGGPFDIDPATARDMLRKPNPHSKPNSDVIVRWINGRDITERDRGMWIIDFGLDMTAEAAAKYEAPFEHVRKKVKPTRANNKRAVYRDRWWIHVEPRSGMRAALASLERYVATPRVSKHRLFKWIQCGVIADSATIVFAREDDYFFGVLHSKPHEVWALKMGTQLESRPRYTPTTTFETFPFPKPSKAQEKAIGEAACELNELRENWLNPPEGSISDTDLKKRTLTNLYNARPAWLDNAHRKLDRAVFAAYGWNEEPGELTEEEMLARLLELNLAREAVQSG